MEEVTLFWSNRMKNDVDGKLLSIEDRKEKVWTVIVFKHFSKELIGFLSNAASVENLQWNSHTFFDKNVAIPSSSNSSSHKGVEFNIFEYNLFLNLYVILLTITRNGYIFIEIFESVKYFV